MDHVEENKHLGLLAQAAKMALGKNFDLRSAEGLEALRDFAKEIAATPDSEESEQILDLMESLDPEEPELIHITPKTGVQRVECFIPQNQRVLKKGRSYSSASQRGFDPKP